MADNEELILIQRYTSRHMRHWWSKSGAVWLALLVVCLLTSLFIDPISTFTARHLHFDTYWLLVGNWFPAIPVAICMAGALEASKFAEELLKNTTIPGVRLPMKIRALVCFSQCVWPALLLAATLIVLTIIQWTPHNTILMQSVLHLPGFRFSIYGLDLIEFALICLWCIGLLVVMPDKPWMSLLLLACFFIYSSNDVPLSGSAGRPPFDALDSISTLLEVVSYAAIVSCIIAFSRGWHTSGYKLYSIIIIGAVLGIPDWMGAVTARGWASYLPGGSSFLPSGMCEDQAGYLFAWVVPSLDDTMLISFVNLVWVGVQYLIFFNFVFEDHLIAPAAQIKNKV